MSDKVLEFPLLKEVDSDEALQVGNRVGAKTGILIFDCLCGCGRLKSIHIGKPTHRDLLFYAEHLRNYSMEQYCESLEENETNNGEVS